MTSEEKRYSRLRWQVFLSATIGYGIYYVCRLSLNVVKKPLVDSGALTEIADIFAAVNTDISVTEQMRKWHLNMIRKPAQRCSQHCIIPKNHPTVWT